jgi:hypothetical protein
VVYSFMKKTKSIATPVFEPIILLMNSGISFSGK